MAFTRKVAHRHPPCGIYGCTNRATHECGVCQRILCEECLTGHAKQHAKRYLAGV